MVVYTLRREQFLPSTPYRVWTFISSPGNLRHLTPKMGFDILTPNLPDRIYPGMLIYYRVIPFRGFNTRWLTEITQVKEQEYFVDVQRLGPYRFWHHEHHIQRKEDGVLMVDLIHYIMPFGFIGRFIHWLFVRKKLETIFDYRREKLDSFFTKKTT